MRDEDAIEAVRPTLDHVLEFEVDPRGRRDEWLGLRDHDVTASTGGCLVCDHDYITPRKLYALKRHEREEDPEETPAMQRGRLMEPVAVELLRELLPHWKFLRPNVYLRSKLNRMGATPDLFALDPERQGFGAIQIKNPNPWVYKAKWVNPETDEITPPLWTAIQALIEADLCGASWCAVAPFRAGGGLEIDLIEVPIHRPVMTKMASEVDIFWQRVAAGDPPPFKPGDADLIEALYNPINPAEIVDLGGNTRLMELWHEREILSKGASAAKKRIDEIKPLLLQELNGAALVRLKDGRLLRSSRVERAGYSVKPKSFIDLRIASKKK